MKVALGVSGGIAAYKAAEIVRNGLIGKVTHVEVGLPGGHSDFKGPKDKMLVTEPPPELDYDFWTGPSKLLPYIEARIHMNWRWHYNTGGGQLLDWIGHHGDIAHWGLDFDNSGPLEVEGTGEFPPQDAVWNTATKYRIECKYPNDIELVIAGGYGDIKSGTKWIGTDGWVWVNRGKAFESSHPGWEDVRELPEEQRKVKLYKSRDHQGNFLECVKSRKAPICEAEIGHRSATLCHLGAISVRLGRKVNWDPAKEEFIDDKDATAYMSREMRKPWDYTAI